MMQSLVAQIPGEEVSYYHNDHLGTPQKMTDASGTVVWEAEYLPFGKATVNEDPDSDGITVSNNIRFPGQYYDQETGLHYNRHRDYKPEIGRYIESDPIGFTAGVNLYIYVQNNPLAYIDPLGLIKWNGSASLGSVLGFVGSSVVHFSLESECVNNKKSRVSVWAVGPSFGLGGRFSFSVSSVLFEDYDSGVNCDNFNGIFLTVSGAITAHPGMPVRPPGNSIPPGPGPGIGIGSSYTRLGNAFSTSILPGFVIGYDRSLSGTIGSSTVTECKTVCCP